MARNHSSASEATVPIDAIVGRFGVAAEMVWQRLKEGDAFLDWDSTTWVVRWSTAKRVADEIRAVKEESDRQNAAMRDEQEREIREQLEAAQRRAAARAGEPRTFGGTRVSLPGDPEPDWMKAPSERGE